MNKYLKYFSGTLVGLMLSTSAFAAAEYAVVLKTLSNPFWVDMKKGIEDEAKTLGVSVDIFASPSEGDFQSQLQLFEDLSNKNYKGIAFAPLSSVNLVMPVARAWKKGIYLVNLDEKIDMDNLKKAGGNVEAFVTTDNVAVGAKGASFIIDKLGAEGGEVAIFGSLSPEYFLTTNNITQIFVQSSVTVLIGMGEFFAILVAGIDLSVGAILALSGMVTAKLMLAGVDPFLAAMIGGVLVGGALGAINGCLVNWTGLHPFIITLGTNAIFRGGADTHFSPVDNIDATDFFRQMTTNI